MSNRVPPAGRTDRRISPRHWSLRVKLAVVLLVPGVLAVVLGGFRIADRTSEAAELDRVSRFAAVQGEIATLVERLQLERNASAAFVAGGRTGDVAVPNAAFAEVDAAAAGSRPAVENLYAGDAGLIGAHRQAQQALARLPGLRNLVLTSNAPASAAIARYSELIAQLVQLDSTLLRGINTAEVNGLASGLAGLGAARNEATLQLALVTAAAGGGDPPAAALAGLPASDARLRTGLSDFRAALDPGQRVRYGSLIAGAANGGRDRLVQGLLARGGTQPVLPATVGEAAATAYGAFLAEVDAAEDGVRTELTTTSAARRQAAVNLAAINSALLLAALVIGAILVGLIARAMITSLRTLRRSALDVAQTRLPEAVQRMRDGSVPDVNVEPVPVTTREEVGEVARAFDAVHLQAVRLAAEQATLQNSVNAMFINLSRRSQILVDRQLTLIEDLESHEEDPDQLSSLFRLDHLATRMRRNSENLLVLAGTDATKRTSRRVPIVDVLQAAVSEIEEYARITVEQPPAVTVVGRAAGDLQHLLAELLDNATSFSPPDSTVTMTTGRSENGSLVVEITDRGVGMPAHELAEVNAEIGRRSPVTVSASRQMGLFVVGRLASRHGVEVRLVGPAGTPGLVQGGGRAVGLADSPGLTARVTIPPYLIDVEAAALESPTSPVVPAGRPAVVPRQRADDGSEPAASTAPAPTPRPRPADPAPRPVGALATADGNGTLATTRPRPYAPGTRPADIPGSGAGAPDPDGRTSQIPEPTPALASAVTTAAPAAPASPARAGDALGGWQPGAPDTMTPIFQEVASGWFRSHRQVPINWQADPPEPALPSPPSTSPPPPPPPPPDRQAAAAPRVSTIERPSPVQGSAAFATAADDGWQAAARVAGHADTLTDTGLPRRTPGARLLPGSIAAPPASPPTRDADTVRSRLDDYQSGVRRGRHALAEPPPDPADT